MRGVFHEDAADVYAPTPSQEASRLITWFAATEGLQVHGLDCVQAYLNSPAPTEKGKRIFVHFPKERKREGWVLLLHKYLYGLRRAARAWATCLRNAFVKLGYKRLVTELCTYVKTHRDSTRTIAQVHVDDMKIVGKASKLIDGLRKVGIEVTDEGPLTSHLGIQYVATSKGIFEHMERTTRRVLSDFGYAPGTCKKATTPLNDDSQWSTRGFKTGVNKLAKVDMRKIVGALLWIRRCVRLDIAVALHKLSVTSDDKRFEQEHRADQLLRYLASTVTRGILYRRGSSSSLQLWPDASWANEEGRKSRAGYVITLGQTPIAWYTGLLNGVKRSTAEAEYGAAFRCATDCMALKNLIRELGWSVKTTGNVIHEDNTACISEMIQGPITKSAKTYEIEQYYLTEVVQKGEYTISKVDTTEQLGDLSTKPLPAPIFTKHVMTLMTDRSEAGDPTQ